MATKSVPASKNTVYLAVYDGAAAEGKTLSEAYQNLEDQVGGLNIDDIDFYRAEMLDVEFQVTEKFKPVEVG